MAFSEFRAWPAWGFPVELYEDQPETWIGLICSLPVTIMSVRQSIGWLCLMIGLCEGVSSYIHR